jgi:hypothetical protein
MDERRSLLGLEETGELYRSEHLGTSRLEIIGVPRADDICAVFGGRLANNSIFEVVVPPNGSNSAGM